MEAGLDHCPWSTGSCCIGAGQEYRGRPEGDRSRQSPVRRSGERCGLLLLRGRTRRLLAVIFSAFVAITTLWVDAAKARDQATAAGSLARQQSDVERRNRYLADISAAASELELDHADEARSLLEDLPEEHRNWEWRYLAGQLDNSTTVFRPEVGRLKAFDLAPDGKSFAYAVGGSPELRLRRTVEPPDVARFGGLASAITFAPFSPEGTRVAAGSADGEVRVWLVEGGVTVAALKGQESAIRQPGL